MIEPVDDPDDPRLEAYRGVRERDLVGRQGRFIAEGQVVLERLVAQSRHQTLSVLIAAKRLEALQPILERLPSDTPIYSASQAVMDAVVGFHIHRGILALAAAAPQADPAGLLQTLGEDALVVVLCGVANHDNMGGVFRNAAAFGVGAVLLDAHCCDPLYRKAIRVSVGGVLSVPFARLAADADLPRTLAEAGFQGLALSPGGSMTLAQVRRERRCAVVFGTEGEGLPADLLTRMASVRIPMSHGFDSLNLATTSGIVLHQLA